MFWRQVDKTRNANGCWEWTGVISKWGYGFFGVNYRTLRAHRISWKLHTGKDPADLVLHKCDNRKCVNPDHLFEGSYLDNRRDAVSKGRHSHGLKHSLAILPNRPRGQFHWKNAGVKP